MLLHRHGAAVSAGCPTGNDSPDGAVAAPEAVRQRSHEERVKITSRRRSGKNEGRGLFERLMFSFMGPPQLGEHRAPDGSRSMRQ